MLIIVMRERTARYVDRIGLRTPADERPEDRITNIALLLREDDTALTWS